MLFDKSELPALWDSSGRDHRLLDANDFLVSRWRFIFDLSSANKRSRSFFYSKSNHALIFSSVFKGVFFQLNLGGETTRAPTSPVILNQTRSVSASGSVNELLISSAALMRRIQHSETNLHKNSKRKTCKEF